LPAFLAALWWGSLSSVGFMVVPLLFARLPTPAVAGNMAAVLFSALTWVAVVCGLLLLMLSRRGGGQPTWDRAGRTSIWVAAGMLLALLSEFAVAPHIVARDNLALWHGVGTGLYALQWVCAGVVLWRVAAAAR
jgi:uncharacterized membrane protein